MKVLKAKVIDPTHLELAQPVQSCSGQDVLVSIDDYNEETAEHKEWMAASESTLVDAYDESEPDYSASMVKEHNPEYGG